MNKKNIESQNNQNDEMKLYAVVVRNVSESINIDWTYPVIMTNNYDDIIRVFKEEKDKILKSSTNEISVEESSNVCCVKYNNMDMYRQVEIVNLY